MGLEDMMQMAGQVKEKLARAQAEAMQATAEGEAGGGLVRARVNGRHQVIGITIDPSMASAETVVLLQDLVRAAVNQANEKLAETIRERMTSISKDFGFDARDFDGLFQSKDPSNP